MLDGSISPHVAQTLTVLRRLFLKPAAARLLFTWGDSGRDGSSGGSPGLPRLSADADEAGPVQMLEAWLRCWLLPRR